MSPLQFKIFNLQLNSDRLLHQPVTLLRCNLQNRDKQQILTTEEQGTSECLVIYLKMDWNE